MEREGLGVFQLAIPVGGEGGVEHSLVCMCVCVCVCARVCVCVCVWLWRRKTESFISHSRLAAEGARLREPDPRRQLLVI
jgi:hypothetical protein